MAHSGGNRLSVSAYAKHRGVSRQAVYNALRERRIEKESDGTIDVAKADQMWAENTGVAAGRTSNAASNVMAPRSPSRRPNGSELMTIEEAERARRHYVAEQERLKYEEAAGSLVSLDEAMRMWATIAATVRTRIMSVPVALGFASEVLACETEHQVRMLLEERLHAALVDLVEDYRGVDQADDEDEGAAS